MQTLKITRSILVLGLMFSVLSCDKKLDVPAQNNITPDQIQTAEDVRAVLGGAYALLQSPNSLGERWLIASDLLADAGQINWIGTFVDYRHLTNKQTITTNAIANGIWGNAYTNINVINTILDKIDLITDPDEKTAMEGEARAIRGMIYYYLVNYFAQPWSTGNSNANLGVPIMLEPVYAYDSTKHKVSRSTVAQVYAQIIADLTDAASKLDNSNLIGVNQATAQAFLARVYLAQGNYASAATQADLVISSGDFELAGTYFGAFNNLSSSSEDIFAIQQTSQSNAGTTNNGLPTFYAAQPVGRGDAQTPVAYFDGGLFEAADERGDFWYSGVSIAGQSGRYTAKFMDIYKAIPVVRLAEMYLTRGEANLRKGGAPIGGVDPLDDINAVRERSGATTLGAVTIADFLNERFRELAFEGDRLWTLKRTQSTIDGRPYNDNKLILPIPQREIDVNKNLTQNDGYQ